MSSDDPHLLPEPSHVSEFIPTRYPYTYCADHIRQLVGYEKDFSGISRGQAARLKSEIARILDLNEREFAEKIADDYLRQHGIKKP